jgi:hypothetical protein
VTHRGATTAISLPIALAIWLAVPWPVLAHGLRLDEDHLWQDLALNFGVPLLVLAVGALAGIGLSMWMNRHGAPTVDEADEAADLDEPIGHPGPR